MRGRYRSRRDLSRAETPWNPRDGRRGAQNPRRTSPRRETSSSPGMTLDGVDAGLMLARGATRRRRVFSSRARRVCAALATLCALVALANRLFPADDKTEATTQRRRLADYRALILAGQLCFDYFVVNEPYTGPYFCLAPQPCFGGVDFVSCQRNSPRARAARRRRQFLTERRGPRRRARGISSRHRRHRVRPLLAYHPVASLSPRALLPSSDAHSASARDRPASPPSVSPFPRTLRRRPAGPPPTPRASTDAARADTSPRTPVRSFSEATPEPWSRTPPPRLVDPPRFRFLSLRTLRRHRPSARRRTSRFAFPWLLRARAGAATGARGALPPDARSTARTSHRRRDSTHPPHA